MARNNAPEQLERWVRPSTQPKHIDLDHPALVDIAWAADRIADLEAYLLEVKQAARRCENENTRLRQSRGDVLLNSAKLKKERDRLLALATKHCNQTHRDWQEILRIAGDA